MREGGLARPLAVAGQFVWGSGIGLLSLAAGGAALLAGAWLWSATTGWFSGDMAPAASKLIVVGQGLTDLGGAGFALEGDRMSLRVTCRGGCDDLVIQGPVGNVGVRVRDSAGECVLCGRDVIWRPVTGEAARLSGRKTARLSR